ncbi:MAG TPA: PAS domain S-box protein, partial [Methanoregula sp.]|nr:PAS domain S-box protein [Methanoregula sp.]
PLDELVGARFLDFVHPDDLSATLNAISDLSNQKMVINFTNRYRHRDGTYRWIEWRSFPKGDRIYAAARDITERKLILEELRKSEEKYRSIIEEMQDLFYRTDLQGKITMLSPSAAKISGYDSIDQLIGMDVTSVYVDPAERETLLSLLREKGSVDSFPMRLKVRDGSIRYVTTSSHFYRDTAGNIMGVEGVIHDITEQRRAEDALRMANKKLHLLSSVTRHDIRNQLMALMAFLELSLDSIDNPAELAEFLKKNQKIADTITRQITFTKDYEDLGLEAPSWQSVDAGIDEAVTGLPLRNIRIRKDTGGLELFADPLVEKVFYNLIDNSLRYGGTKMTTISVSTHAAGPARVLVFADDGEGIPDRDKKVIFDKGFGKNTGLGLYLSREILAITGITIAETGIPGTGARFEMTIPEGGFRFAGVPG